MSLVFDEMLSRLSRMFGEPRTSDPQGYLDEFERALRSTSRDVLRRATDDLIDNADKPFWPTVGEAKAACARAATALAAEARYKAGVTPPETIPEPTEAQKARIQKLVDDAKTALAGSKLEGAP